MTRMRTAPPARANGRAPARRKAGIAARLGGVAVRCLALAARRPVAVLGAIGVMAGVTAIVWNTTHQSGRHPAPLFAAAQPASSTAVPQAVPLPVPRPDPVQLAAATPPAPAVEPVRSAGADPIGALIRADAGGRAGADGKAGEPRSGDSARLVSAQKALVKLGYGPLKTDGLFGATTRQALERFERDRNLPVTGAVAGRTARQLATLSGYPVE